MAVFLAYHQGDSDYRAWSLFFLGAATLVLIEIVARIVLPAFRSAVLGDLIWATVLLGLGTERWDWLLPIILIAIGCSLLHPMRLRI